MSVGCTFTLAQKPFPQLVVVLVNGGLTQEQIASAFKEGAKDYFSDTYV